MPPLRDRQVSKRLLTIGLALAQLAAVQARPPLRTTGSGYDGVIIDRGVEPGVRYPAARPGVWIPTENDVRDVERRLPAYLVYVKAASGLRHPRILSELTRYKRQYWGELVGSRRLMRILFYHEDTPVIQKGTWMKGAVSVMGGGDSYFQVTYEMDRGRFTNLWVNAPE